MLYFERNKVNKFVVVATDKLETTMSEFLFRFTDETSNIDYDVTLTDYSDFPKTYNKFEINLPNDIDFKHNGDYRFQVLRLSDNEVLTVGRMRLEGADISSKNYDEINPEIKQYERQGI